MLTERFLAATLTTNKVSSHASALKDVGIFLQEFQPQNGLRQGFKKSSAHPRCVAISDTHVFAAQADKAVIHVYSRERGNQEATVPLPERIQSVALVQDAAILVLGTEGGKLILWETATGRLSNSTAAHLQPVSSLSITGSNAYVLSGSADSSVHVWSLPHLVSFFPLGDTYTGERAPNSPVRTFSNHRDGITALSCGHSKDNTNFAVSTSRDQTCYLWHIETGQVLRSVLLPAAAISVAVDPADRVIYFGDEQGFVHFLDIFRSWPHHRSSVLDSHGGAPIQLMAKDAWAVPTPDLGAAHCLTLSYDGTALLSGHANGAVVHWDVAKHRVVNEVVKLLQPVTNIQMLKPDGLLNQKRAGYTVLNVVKPNLEFNAQIESRPSTGVPANYNLLAASRLTRSNSDVEEDEFDRALSSPGIPQSMFDQAIRSLALGSSGGGTQNSSTYGDDAQLAQVEKLEDEVSRLKQQAAVLLEVEERRKERSIARMQRREELGLKKRQAYFDAKKRGQDGDAAMKEWEEKEAMIDVESDDEHLGEGMDIG